MVAVVSGSTALPPDGVTVALLTPMAPDGVTVDGEALDRIVGRAVAAGVAGFSPCGSTGEGWRLSRAQRREVVSRVAAASDGRPVIAGLPVANVPDAVDDIADLAAQGADAVLVAPPGYYPSSDAETVALFTDLAERSPVPLVLYEIPALAKASFSVAAVGELARHPRIVGMKDSSRDLEYLHGVLQTTAEQDFRVVTGVDTLLPESHAMGVVGTVAASANVAPELTTGLYEACVASMAGGADTVVPTGADERVRDRRDAVAALVAASRAAGVPGGWKAAASLAGLCERTPVPPGRPPAPESLDRLKDVLRHTAGGNE